MTQLEIILRIIGAIAVIAGTILVVLQLRVNAKQARSRSAFDTVAAVDSTAAELDEGERFSLCRPDALAELFRAGGPSNVRCEPIEIIMEFESFDDYWRPLLGGTGPAHPG